MDQSIDVLEQRIPCKLRSVHVVRRIELIRINRVVPKHLKHRGKRGDITQEIKSHVFADMLQLKVPPHSLGRGMIHFRAVLTGQPIVELLASWERNFVKSLELVDVIVAEHLLLLYQLNHFINLIRIKVSHCSMQKEVFLPSGLCKLLKESVERGGEEL